MIELKNDQLSFSFPDVHPSAKLNITSSAPCAFPMTIRRIPCRPDSARFRCGTSMISRTAVPPPGWNMAAS